MKTHKGFAPVVIILIIALVGGAVIAYVSRDTLKTFFETGDVPTQEQFGDTIDSEVNLSDDKNMTGSKEYTPTKQYQAGDTAVMSSPIYEARVLSTVNAEFKLDADQPVTFKWVPTVSKSQDPVTYRLRVWQLMQGQNGASAMKSNQPIVTKDVDTATEATVSGIYTGPCKPPYLCDFVWSVEAVTSVSADSSTGGVPSTGTR